MSPQFRYAILLLVEYCIGVDFPASVLRRFAKAITGRGLENAIEGDVMKKKTVRK